MKKQRMLLGIGILAAVLTASLNAQATVEDSANSEASRVGHVHKYVTGTVSEIKAGTLFLKTDEGTTRTFSVKEAELDTAQRLKVGDRLRLEIEEGNQIIDIDHIAGDGGPGHPEDHQTLTGSVVRFSRADKQVTLKLLDGRTISYKLKDAAATKMNSVKVGSMVDVDVDDENNMINDFLIR